MHNDFNNLENIDLMRELRQKMLKEFKTPAKELTSEQRKDRMLEVRNQFIPEKKKKLEEMSLFIYSIFSNNY